MWEQSKEYLVRCFELEDPRGRLIDEISGRQDCFSSKMGRDMSSEHQRMGYVEDVLVLAFSYHILLRCIDTRAVMKDALC